MFELSAETFGRFDVVYSWGVLHHTGAMHDALERAAQTVAPGGRLVFALYHRTRMCGFWRREKRWYASASPRMQGAARAVYIALLRLRFALTGGDFHAHVATYRSRRGMDFAHDVHDWMGGYPYESISAAEVEALMRRLGLVHVRSFVTPLTIGLFGSGCDEYVYRRRPERRCRRSNRSGMTAISPPTQTASIAGDFARPDLAAEQPRAGGIVEGRAPAVRGALEGGEAEAMVRAAVAHPGAADLLAGEIALDLARQHRAAGAEHELRAALVGETQDLRDVDMAGQRERDAVGQPAVPGGERLLQAGVEGLAMRAEAPDRPVGEEPGTGRGPHCRELRGVVRRIARAGIGGIARIQDDEDWPASVTVNCGISSMQGGACAGVGSSRRK